MYGPYIKVVRDDNMPMRKSSMEVMHIIYTHKHRPRVEHMYTQCTRVSKTMFKYCVCIHLHIYSRVKVVTVGEIGKR